MDRGTPTWSIDRLGSAVMTVRAEKSTRFPIRFPRSRPSFDLSLCRSVFSGFPDRCVACTPSLTKASLSKMAFTAYCRSSSYRSTTCGASPDLHSSSSVRFALTTLTYWCVKSSSLRIAPSPTWTEGRTCGGGTGRTVTRNQSGLANLGFSPSISTSRSDTFDRISCAVFALSACFRSPITVSSASANTTSMPSVPLRLYLGCHPPHPASSSPFASSSEACSSTADACSHRVCVRDTACIAWSRACPVSRCAALTLCELVSAISREQWKHTQRSTMSTSFRKPRW
mmetsp:Transcript_5700/g.17189  ORF Transcript_5700/g.17189 Transcript_5700/m.17189 type:complete len:285 (+) Transcript_5700:1685-2539(+)